MEKIDFKKTLEPLYSPPAGEFASVEVPLMQFVKVDGEGDPNTAPAYRSAVEWLYGEAEPSREPCAWKPT
jgi:hypothetical protein